MNEFGDFEREILKIHKDLVGYALYLTRNEEAANDLVQETLLRMLNKYDKYNEQGCFKSWATTIMKRTFLNEISSKEKYKESFVDGYDYMNDDTVHPLVCENDYEFSNDDLEKALKMIPPKQAQILTMQMVGYKYVEIAKKMNITMGSVKSSLFIAKGHLRKLLNS